MTLSQTWKEQQVCKEPRGVYCIDMDYIRESLAKTQLNDRVAIIKELLEDEDLKQTAPDLHRDTSETLFLNKSDLSFPL